MRCCGFMRADAWRLQQRFDVTSYGRAPHAVLMYVNGGALGYPMSPPTVADHARACAEFSWQGAARSLAGLPGGGINIAHEAVDRHAQGPRAGHLALRWLGQSGETRDIT